MSGFFVVLVLLFFHFPVLFAQFMAFAAHRTVRTVVPAGGTSAFFIFDHRAENRGQTQSKNK